MLLKNNVSFAKKIYVMFSLILNICVFVLDQNEVFLREKMQFFYFMIKFIVSARH